eukprot:CAMPEP_0198231470 /NCGR_PEP_ID=MMETSP1445-20131203/115218_1 /TAXON_ID=36898 /ORGANISM="Pyramimonas sp., Strain CCMP2087" /LENGTH=153 /DNA_ID=CAMNT_0043912085 /DNA_START=547 /DNA_END=1005 /DNA_ORIENTATION=-
MRSSPCAARRAPLLLVVASVLWFGGHVAEGGRSAIVSLGGIPAQDAAAWTESGSLPNDSSSRSASSPETALYPPSTLSGRSSSSSSSGKKKQTKRKSIVTNNIPHLNKPRLLKPRQPILIPLYTTTPPEPPMPRIPRHMQDKYGEVPKSFSAA